MTEGPPLLQLNAVTKRFPGVLALDGVDFTLRKGEIHALMGENGAGKSTLIKVLTGVHQADAGEFVLDGSPIRPRSPLEAQALGISTVYQEVNLIPYLSVAENIFLGRQPRGPLGISWGTINRRAEEALARLDVRIDVSRPLNSYSLAIQQMAAIARALDVEAKVLVLDEPTSSLDANEVDHLFAVLRKLREQGLGIVFVSHFLDQVFAVSDRMTVLRNGRRIGEYETSQLTRIGLIAKMLGTDEDQAELLTAAHHTAAEASASPPLVEALALSRGKTVQGVDLALRPGEVTGIAGLLGAGRTETARILFGIDRADHGSVTMEGRAVKSPRVALRSKMAFCPEDRKAEGVIPGLSIRENIVLALQASRGWARRIPRSKQTEIAKEYISTLRIAASGPEQAVGTLSGGNQQKVLLARWLASQPRVLILDEPTRGIDVGAKAEIEKLVATLSAEGMAVLFISSEIDEVVRDSQRVVVLREGRKVGELTGSDINAERVLGLMAAGAHA